jgi:hypothetical protein
LRRRIRRDVALREIARCFLSNAGMTVPGELARVTGLSRPDAGLGNRALVAEGYATMAARGVYVLAAPFDEAGGGDSTSDNNQSAHIHHPQQHDQRSVDRDDA